MRYLVRERAFDIGEDYWVEDERGERAFLIDGKAMRLRRTFVMKTPDGHTAAVIKAKTFGLRAAMCVERDDDLLATVREKRFTPLRAVFRAELTERAGGGVLEIRGDLADKEYEIVRSRDGQRLASISRQWFRVRDSYAVDVDEGADAALLIAIAVCVDQLESSDE